MTLKEMIDDLLKRGKIEPNELIAMQLQLAMEKIDIQEKYILREKTTINGKEIEHLDVVFHTTRTKFRMWDRIKILLGKEVVIESELYTMHEHCKIAGSKAKGYVPKLFPSKEKGGIFMMAELN